MRAHAIVDVGAGQVRASFSFDYCSVSQVTEAGSSWHVELTLMHS